jgi:hypothetical protein
MYHVEFSRAFGCHIATYDCSTLADAKEKARRLVDKLVARSDGYVAIYDGDEPDALWVLYEDDEGRFDNCDLDMIG